MYYDPYNSFINQQVKNDIEKINEKIAEEKSKPQCDSHKLNRMNEQKLIQGLFDNQLLGSTYGKYRSPW